MDTLTIVARPEYNGTGVVCVARYDNESPEESTDTAILDVQGKHYIHVLIYHGIAYKQWNNIISNEFHLQVRNVKLL